MSKELVINNISQFSFLNWTEQVEFRERGCFFYYSSESFTVHRSPLVCVHGIPVSVLLVKAQQLIVF